MTLRRSRRKHLAASDDAVRCLYCLYNARANYITHRPHRCRGPAHTGHTAACIDVRGIESGAGVLVITGFSITTGPANVLPSMPEQCDVQCASDCLSISRQLSGSWTAAWFNEAGILQLSTGTLSTGGKRFQFPKKTARISAQVLLCESIFREVGVNRGRRTEQQGSYRFNLYPLDSWYLSAIMITCDFNMPVHLPVNSTSPGWFQFPRLLET